MIDLLLSFGPPLALLLVGAKRSLDRDINLGDEGYLVYGTLALLRGEVPIRDFRAYDPGRYLWCALFFRLFGPGFMSARIAMACLSALAVCLIVALSLRVSDAPVLAALTGSLAVLWMQPNHKQGEMLFSVVSVAVIFALLAPQPPMLAVTALIVAGALYGHNILVYIILALCLFALAKLGAGEPVAALMADLVLWLAAGFGGMLALAALIPGYLAAFWARKIRVVLTRGSANLPLPRPWLWSGRPAQIAGFSPARQWAFKLLFTAVPVLHGAAVLAWCLSPELRALPEGRLILAAGITGLAYTHHLLSRADMGHLCQVILPLVLLLGSTAGLLPAPLAGATVLALCAASAGFLWRFPEFQRRWGKRGPEAAFETQFERLRVAPVLAKRLEDLKALIMEHSAPHSAILSVPMNIAILAALERRSAVYDCFPVYPAQTQQQLRMIDELKLSQPTLAIIGKQRVDGRQDLQFERNYAQVIAYLSHSYTPILTTPFETVYLRRP